MFTGLRVNGLFAVKAKNFDKAIKYFDQSVSMNRMKVSSLLTKSDVLKALKKVDFNGVIIVDHVPSMVGGMTASAFSVGYLKALVERVIEEG